MARVINQKIKCTRFNFVLEDGKIYQEIMPGIVMKPEIRKYIEDNYDVAVRSIPDTEFLECVFQMDKQDFINNSKIITERNLNND